REAPDHPADREADRDRAVRMAVDRLVRIDDERAWIVLLEVARGVGEAARDLLVLDRAAFRVASRGVELRPDRLEPARAALVRALEQLLRSVLREAARALDELAAARGLSAA